jgi:hypothetical protein
MKQTAALFALILSTAALAMGLHTTTTSLAKSTDGTSELFEEDSSGPEGGGVTAFRIVGYGAGHGPAQTFEVSNDLSPGDGSRPQSVSEKECRGRLADLAALLKARGFKGVRVRPDVCAQKVREGAVIAP